MTKHKLKTLTTLLIGVTLLLIFSAGCLLDNYEAIVVTYVGNTTPDNVQIIHLNEEDFAKYPGLKEFPNSVSYADKQEMYQMLGEYGVTGEYFDEESGLTLSRTRYIEWNGSYYAMRYLVS